MSRVYEFQGKNVEQALERASDDLNVPAEKIKYEVLTYGSSGIFGLVGVKKAKIKVLINEKESNRISTQDIENIEDNQNFSVYQARPADQATTTNEEYQEIVDFGSHALQKIVDGISAGASVNTDPTNERLFFSVTGGDSGVLIGKRGQTLEAIQYLLEKMINKRTTRKIRVQVDIEGYLEKRKNNLKQLASRMAEKAKKTQKPVTIGQMNAHDRRIVHIHLKDENGIRTQSIGDGYYRKLMIFPKKRRSPKGKGNN